MVFQHFYVQNSFIFKGILRQRLTSTHRKNIEKPMVFQQFHVQNSFIYKGILNQNGRTGGLGLQVSKLVRTAYIQMQNRPGTKAGCN